LLGVNLPEALDEENVTVPVGEYPVTVTMHNVDEPATRDAGVQERVVLEV